MLRELMSGSELPDEQTYANVMTSGGLNYNLSSNMDVTVGFLSVTILICSRVFPKQWPLSMYAPYGATGLGENVEDGMMRWFSMFLITGQMSANFNIVILGEMFQNLGACAGAVFFGFLSSKIGRKPTVLVSHILRCVMLIIMTVVVSNFVTKRFTMMDRGFVTGAHAGNRKIRPLLDPWLVKAVGNQLSFKETFNISMQQFLMLRILFGFTGPVMAVCQTALLETLGSTNNALMFNGTFCMTGIYLYHCGRAWFIVLYPLMDFEGVLIFTAVWKVVQIAAFLVVAQETRDFEGRWKDLRDAERLKHPCWLKGVYFAMWCWPQGAVATAEINTFMIFSRHHWASTSAGFFVQRSYFAGFGGLILQDALFRVAHIPIIGRMFWMTVVVANPLWTSLFMELCNVFRNTEGLVGYNYWLFAYPVFSGIYMQIESIPWFLGVCDSMRHLGIFLSDARWPSMLLCGDPMYCWRSQYTYSHGLFYNIGGDGGNINYITWFLFCKSQKRQCCCPYRKLKADAPEKCCPPCCLGPYVEETGGCTCPCCCASCSGRPNSEDSKD